MKSEWLIFFRRIYSSLLSFRGLYLVMSRCTDRFAPDLGLLVTGEAGDFRLRFASDLLISESSCICKLCRDSVVLGRPSLCRNVFSIDAVDLRFRRIVGDADRLSPPTPLPPPPLSAAESAELREWYPPTAGTIRDSMLLESWPSFTGRPTALCFFAAVWRVMGEIGGIMACRRSIPGMVRSTITPARPCSVSRVTLSPGNGKWN